MFYVLTNTLQAMGAAAQALVINLSRQGIIYTPALFVLQVLLKAEGLAWAQPAADLLSTAFVALLYLRTSRRMMAPAAPSPWRRCSSGRTGMRWPAAPPGFLSGTPRAAACWTAPEPAASPACPGTASCC